MDLSLRSIRYAVFLSLALLNSFFIVFATSYNIKPLDDLVDDICSRTRNRSLCEQTLRSCPQPPGGTNLDGLCQISIDASQATANTTYNLIGILKKNESDPKILEVLDVCLYGYRLAIEDIGSCSKSLAARDYKSVYTSGVAASLMEESCKTTFEEEGLEEPIQLKQANRKFGDLANIVVVIANLLSGNML